MGPASQRAGETAVAGVIARPPFLYLACLVLGVALDRLLPLPLTFPEVTLVRWTAGGGLIAVGLAIMAAGIRNFSHAATPVPSNRPVNRHTRLEPQSDLRWHVSTLCRHRLSCAARGASSSRCLSSSSCAMAWSRAPWLRTACIALRDAASTHSTTR